MTIKVNNILSGNHNTILSVVKLNDWILELTLVITKNHFAINWFDNNEIVLCKWNGMSLFDKFWIN